MTELLFTNRCSVEECDLPGSNYYEPHTNWSIPKNGKDLDSCNRYTNSELPQWNHSVEICSADHFTKNKEACAHNEFVFRDDEVTISNDVSVKAPQGGAIIGGYENCMLDAGLCQ